MTATYTALVVEDHPLMAEATKRLLEQIEGIEVVGVARDGKSCLELVEQHGPDLIFLDFQLPDQSGVQVAERLNAICPDSRVVIFTGVDISDLAHKLLELRVSGIISKETQAEGFRQLVSSILNNHIVLPREVFYKLKLSPSSTLEDRILTRDEVYLMSLVVQGLTHDQVAENIFMSKRSVDNYLKKIYEKLGVQNKSQAIETFVRIRSQSE